MILYDFKCEKCLHEFEKLVNPDTIQVSCPQCNEMANKKLTAPGGFVLKGDGFYKPSSSV